MRFDSSKQKTTATYILILLLSIAIAIAGRVVYLQLQPLASPLFQSSAVLFFSEKDRANSSKKVYGFLPYWNLSKTTIHPELTNLAYFGLTFDADGEFVYRDGDAAELGYNRLSSEQLADHIATTQDQAAEFEIVLIQFDNQDIEAFLADPEAQDHLLTQLDSVILSYPISGVNIDVEYSGEVSDELRANYVSFIKKAKAHLNQKNPAMPLSIDVYASAATKKTIWDIPALAPHVDQIVVMAYDFHRASSIVAGPVAPLFGGADKWDEDITRFIQAFLKDVPSNKILLGIPFYGYGWQTTTNDAGISKTFPKTGETYSLARVKKLKEEAIVKDELNLVTFWDDTALAPFLTYQPQENVTYTVYYEDSRSISYKIDLVNQLDLGGIAIWALGYEESNRELWDLIERKL